MGLNLAAWISPYPIPKAKNPANVISIEDFLRSETNSPITFELRIGARAYMYLFTVGRQRFPE